MTTFPDKDLYSILGVPPEATPEAIRDAYRSRARIVHPDRIDRRQTEVWNKANEMLTELNQAYSILKDPTARKDYDQSRASRTHSGPTPSSPPGRTRGRTSASSFVHGDLTPGQAVYQDLPKPVQERLLTRQAGTEPDQFRFRLASVTTNYVCTLLLLTWFLFLFHAATAEKWEQDTTLTYGGITLTAGLLIGHNILSIARWHLSTLKSFLYLTPIYIIKTQYDNVTFYPLWTLQDIAATHKYANSFYQGSTVTLEFDGRKETLRFSASAASKHSLSTSGLSIPVFAQRSPLMTTITS